MLDNTPEQSLAVNRLSPSGKSLLRIALIGFMLARINAISAQEGNQDLSGLPDLCRLMLPQNLAQVEQDYLNYNGAFKIDGNNIITVEGQQIYDINDVDRHMAGDRANLDILTEGGDLPLSAEITGETDPEKYNVVLVGTLFENDELLQKSLSAIADEANAVFGAEKINFVFANTNYDIPLNRVERLAILGPLDTYDIYEGLEAANPGIVVDKLVIVLGDSTLAGGGSTPGLPPIIAGHPDVALNLLAHEVVGHSIANLGDGYQREYDISQLIDATEIFVPGTTNETPLISEHLSEAYRLTYRCGDVPVYSFYDEDIMDRGYQPHLIEDLGVEGIFNPMQLERLRYQVDSAIEFRYTPVPQRP